MNKRIQEYIFCLNEERYFEAHEVFESFWFPRRHEDDNEIKVIKGFINAAVSFELIKRRRIPQSQKVWKTYLKYKKLISKTDSNHTQKYLELSKIVEEKMLKLLN
jgi:hypothetical protein